jgi:hypothetical protein
MRDLGDKVVLANHLPADVDDSTAVDDVCIDDEHCH